MAIDDNQKQQFANKILNEVDTTLETTDVPSLKVPEQQTSITSSSLTGLYINGVHYQLVDASTAAGVSIANENLETLANQFGNFSKSSKISSFIENLVKKLASNIASAHLNDTESIEGSVSVNSATITNLQNQLNALSDRLAQIQFIGENTKENIAALPENTPNNALVVAKEQTKASGGLISQAIELKS